MKTATRKSKHSLGVAPRVVAPVVPRDPVEQYASFVAKIHREIAAWKASGRAAREAFAAKILDGNDDNDRIDLLVSAVKWGDGVDADLTAGLAAQLEYQLTKAATPMIALQWFIDDCERTQRCAIGNSTNPYSNAVDSTRAEVARRFADRLQWWLAHLTELRAEMEVL